VAPAISNPEFFVILPMVHHFQNVQNSLTIVDASNQPKAIVPHVKYYAVPDLVSRPERLLETSEIGWVSVFCDLKPSEQILFSDGGVLLSSFPELP